MNKSRRREIVNYLVNELKSIPTLNNNVFRRIKFFDEINDFPSVYIQAGEETRIYESKDLTSAELTLVLRCYAKLEIPTQQLEEISQEIEQLLYSLPSNPSIGIIDITIDSISNDEGLLAPYGMGEIYITIYYELGL